MAVVIGVNRTKALDPYGNNLLDPGLFSGRVRSITDTYESLILISGSVIDMGPTLPVGAIVVGGRLATDALGVLGMLSVGTSAAPTKFLAATQCSTAAVTVFPDTIGGMNYVVTGTTDNILKISTTLGSCSGTITLETMYIVD